MKLTKSKLLEIVKSEMLMLFENYENFDFTSININTLRQWQSYFEFDLPSEIDPFHFVKMLQKSLETEQPQTEEEAANILDDTLYDLKQQSLRA